MTVPAAVYRPTAERTARAIVGAKAYLFDPTRMFKWKCGIAAPVYTNCRQLRGHPGAREVVIDGLASAARAIYSGATLVVGMEVAGLLWSGPVASSLGLPDAFVRKSPKQHGPSQSLLECSPVQGSKAILLDDLVATGESLEKAIVALRGAEIDVLGILSICNWGFDEMHERFCRLTVPTWALVTYTDLLQAALEAGIFGPSAYRELIRFYTNPRSHQWDLQALSKRKFS